MQFAITEQKSVSSQVVGDLALAIMTPVFTLAEESRTQVNPFLDGSNPSLNAEDHNIISYTRSSKIYILLSL